MELLIGIVFVVAFAAIVLALVTRKGGRKGKQKGRSQIIRDANRKLSQDPHNPDGLMALGELYYNERAWDKAYPLYETMMSVATIHHEIDPFKASLRQGICAVKLNKTADAFRGLGAAFKINKQDFDVNYYLGVASFKNNEFEKAIPCFKRALIIRSDAPHLNSYIGLSMYKAKHFKESLPYLKRGLDENPDNKEVLFCMADAMNEGGYSDKAMKVFMHLRPDPEFGARSCLSCGLFHLKSNQADLAIQDFEIGMKHQNVPQDIMVEIRYRYATACFMTNCITKGLDALKEIQATNPNYKDVPQLAARYQELNKNKNLQMYLMGASSDYVALCRRIVLSYYKKGTAKLLDFSVAQDTVDVLVNVDFIRSEENHMFKFFRSTGSIGELPVRDFHGKVSEHKADKGFLVSAGTYSEEARRFAEGRPIELFDKDMLIKLLKKVGD
ncbi:MAG: restriction endonuclease [Treponema sp.]|nr:restriction endonuclease [Treponema sp.]MBR1615082.1 restriction endonuclease [Treponema sp.]